MDKVVHFEVPADDMKRAQKFYSEVFGWGIQELPEMDYTIVQTMEMDEKQMPRNPVRLTAECLNVRTQKNIR
mgnify:CR=1 FL=1